MRILPVSNQQNRTNQSNQPSFQASALELIQQGLVLRGEDLDFLQCKTISNLTFFKLFVRGKEEPVCTWDVTNHATRAGFWKVLVKAFNDAIYKTGDAISIDC